MFYLPKLDCEENKRLEALINRWGGLCLDFAEAMSYQIKPNFEQGGIGLEEFYAGDIFNASWIEDCIANNHVCDYKGYFMVNIDNSYNVKTIQMGKRKRFTMMEGIQMYALLLN